MKSKISEFKQRFEAIKERKKKLEEFQNGNSNSKIVDSLRKLTKEFKEGVIPDEEEETLDQFLVNDMIKKFSNFQLKGELRIDLKNTGGEKSVDEEAKKKFEDIQEKLKNIEEKIFSEEKIEKKIVLPDLKNLRLLVKETMEKMQKNEKRELTEDETEDFTQLKIDFEEVKKKISGITSKDYGFTYEKISKVKIIKIKKIGQRQN